MRTHFACVLVAALLGCTISPTNGTQVSGSTVGRSLSFVGYVDKPDASVRMQVLNPAAQDPYDPASVWTTIVSGKSSTTSTYLNDPDPIYGFALNGTPVANAAQTSRWPSGGLGRMRVQYQSGVNWFSTTTIDDFQCVIDNLASSWKTIGLVCQSHDNSVLTMVDTDPIPAAGADFISRKETAVGESVGVDLTLSMAGVVRERRVEA